jgi:hypothetical protein
MNLKVSNYKKRSKLSITKLFRFVDINHHIIRQLKNIEFGKMNFLMHQTDVAKHNQMCWWWKIRWRWKSSQDDISFIYFQIDRSFILLTYFRIKFFSSKILWVASHFSFVLKHVDKNSFKIGIPGKKVETISREVDLGFRYQNHNVCHFITSCDICWFESPKILFRLKKIESSWNWRFKNWFWASNE